MHIWSVFVMPRIEERHVVLGRFDIIRPASRLDKSPALLIDQIIDGIDEFPEVD